VKRPERRHVLGAHVRGEHRIESRDDGADLLARDTALVLPPDTAKDEVERNRLDAARSDRRRGAEVRLRVMDPRGSGLGESRAAVRGEPAPSAARSERYFSKSAVIPHQRVKIIAASRGWLPMSPQAKRKEAG